VFRLKELAEYVALVAERDGQETERVVDMAISLRVCDVDSDGTERHDTDEELIEVGGRWDRAAHKFVEGQTETIVILRVPRGSDQEAPARYLAAWFALFRVKPRGPHWDRAAAAGFRRVYTTMLWGGRRSGKSHLAIVALAMMAVMVPDSICWAISPTIERTDELLRALRNSLGRGWFHISKSRSDKTYSFELVNGSVIRCMSGYNPDALRQGRADLTLYNEAQHMTREGWEELRGNLIDRGGMVIIACNPPKGSRGRWLTDVREKAIAAGAAWPSPIAIGGGEPVHYAVQFFGFTLKGNPFVDQEAGKAMAAEYTSKRDYERDLEGKPVPPETQVLHSWSDVESVLARVPETWIDVTRDATARELGRPADYVVGMDFQADPHMPASVIKFFHDPERPLPKVVKEGEKPEPDLIAVVVDEVVVDKADEEMLVDALEGQRPELVEGRWTREGRVEGEGYDPDACGVVMDATGFTQAGDHKAGRTSESTLKRRGWRWLNYPVRGKKSNPLVEERAKVANVVLLNGANRRRLYVLAHCIRTCRAMRDWERMKSGDIIGAPKRTGEDCHICDGVTYPIYRFYARPAPKKKPVTYERIQVFAQRGDL
jgi:hypothetical protein